MENTEIEEEIKTMEQRRVQNQFENDLRLKNENEQRLKRTEFKEKENELEI